MSSFNASHIEPSQPEDLKDPKIGKRVVIARVFTAHEARLEGIDPELIRVRRQHAINDEGNLIEALDTRLWLIHFDDGEEGAYFLDEMEYPD